MGDNVSATLTTVQRDRACGALVGTAAGDALAAANGGEWGNCTARAIPVAELAAIHADLRSEAVQRRIGERWQWWTATVKDAETQRQSVVPTLPVALSCLGDASMLVETARAISRLIGGDADAGDTIVLWCAAIRHAVLTGDLDIRSGLGHLDPGRGQRWAKQFDDAERSPVAATGSGMAAALLGAWSAIVHTPVPGNDPARGVFRVDHLRWTLESVANETAEVAAIAGGLLGASYGASAVPSDWRLILRGWPGLRTRGLIQLADSIIGEAEPIRDHYSTRDQHPPRRHPHDDQLLIGGVGPMARPAQYVPAGVDAIVSLCRVFDTYLRTDATHLDVRLATGENANLDFALLDTVRAIEQLRADGRTVFLHSRLGTNRAPTVAALYGARRRGIGSETALADVLEVLPDANPDNELRAALHRLAGAV